MASAPREAGDLVDIVDKRQFDLLTPDDYVSLTALRDHMTRSVELYTAAKKHLQRAHDARVFEVRDLISAGNFDSLRDSDFRIVAHLLTVSEQKLACSRDAVAACPVSQSTAAAT